MTNLLNVILGVLLTACASSASNPSQSVIAQTALSPGDELALPAIPDTLRRPEQRATFLLAHFWDAMDFADTTLTRSDEFMERNFANFVNLYPHATADSLPAITARFLKKATVDTPSRLLLSDIIQKYLDSPDSPVRSDSSYIIFLTEWVNLPGIDSYELEEPRYRLQAALKNRPGTTAADFSFRTLAGTTSSLSDVKAPKLLLLLYDPDCDHCTETMWELSRSASLNSLIDSGAIKVLAVRVEGDEELWRHTAATLPQNWTVATDISHIIDSELYSIPEMPGIYLLDADKTVIMRQPATPTLLESLDSAR